MPAYQYRPLDAKSSDMRLLTLLPGDFNADIRFRISHIPLVAPVETHARRLSKDELERSVPDGWRVYQTLEDRYLFDHLKNGGDGDTSWTCPNSTISPDLYNPTSALNPYHGFQPEYEALSYTWGDDTKNQELAYVADSDQSPGAGCPSNPTETTLLVRENLALALRHLRSPAKERTLWIDALCINQESTQERSEQVGRMADIYKLAYRVVVWLGPATSGSRLAVSTLEFMGSQIEISRDNSIIRSPQCSEPDWYRTRYPLPFEQKTWQAIESFFERAWFERLWIWQEVHLANSRTIVQCGDDTMSWYNLRRAAICLHEKEELPGPSIRTRLELINRLMRDRSNADFLGLLSVTRYSKASEPRDRVYGILGMANISAPSTAARILPDYNIPVVKVYQQAIVSLLQEEDHLTFLRDCDLSARNITEPSWVPDWSTDRLCLPLNFYLLASGYSRSNARVTETGALEVFGICCGKVDSVKPSLIPRDGSSSNLTSELRSREPANLHQECYVTGESVFEAYLKTLIAGQIKENFPQMPAATLQECKNSYSTYIFSGRNLSEAEVKNDFYLRKVRDWNKGRTFFTSEKHIGLAPLSAQDGKFYHTPLADVLPLTFYTGDHIFVLLGCDTPIMLRPRDTGRFQVVGECYVHGLMNNEALLGYLPKGWDVQARKEPNRIGYYYPAYCNSLTGLVTRQDPRLARPNENPGPGKISEIPAMVESILGFDCNSAPEALKERISDLKTIQLI